MGEVNYGAVFDRDIAGKGYVDAKSYWVRAVSTDVVGCAIKDYIACIDGKTGCIAFHIARECPGS